MKTKYIGIGLILALSTSIISCNTDVVKEVKDNTEATTNNESNDPNRFADIQILQYNIKDFDKLSLNQKKLVYFLAQAGLSGRDIIYDQNFKHNIEIRKAFEKIVATHDNNDPEFAKVLEYAKRMWFSNGIHHHYGMVKFKPEFTKEYLMQLVEESKANLSADAMDAIFSDKYMKRKDKNPDKDMIAASANGFYGDGVTQQMVEDYYKAIIDTLDPTPISYGLNSSMELVDGQLQEVVWKSGGKYGKSIDKIIFWLEQAVTVAENEPQKKGLQLLIEYYKTGDLKKWDEYNIVWAAATEGDIDYINSFIEVYGDALGYRASYESIVQIKDFEASARMKVVEDNTQWFEDNSPILDNHKKKEVKGVTYKVVQVASESGDASPSTPIGVNLPNANWIRANYGSKSVSLGNIIEAYNNVAGESALTEFCHDEEEIERAKKYGNLAGKLHTALHEVVGHASGQINPGVGTPKETLKNYASALEEARADLVGLYYLMDEKLIELGLVESLEVGKAEYDGYIRNGLLQQLNRIEPGEHLEEEHMQNRQTVAAWAFEKGQADNVIEKVERDGKTYYEIHDYMKLRTIFGELLKEIQRIKSEGDYEAGKNLIENYGVKVDPETHKQVLTRYEPLNIAPYRGFINPVLVPVKGENGEITDIKIEYPESFVDQMLKYGEEYSFE